MCIVPCLLINKFDDDVLFPSRIGKCTLTSLSISSNDCSAGASIKFSLQCRAKNNRMFLLYYKCLYYISIIIIE